MSKSKLFPVIMAGGNGSRLWPLSRVMYPKQFLALDGTDSMLQKTVLRLEGLSCENPVVICNEEHRFIVAEQLRKLNKLTKNIILEPVGRNTAPAITLASLVVSECVDDVDVDVDVDKEDPLLLVLAADHVIQNEDAFRKAVQDAIPLAEEGKLVTFGIVATSPETGYGYIKRGEMLPASINDIINSDKLTAFCVDKFVEKPNLEIATEYIESGKYYWNSGMFLFKSSRYLDELKKFRPDIYSACQQSVALADPDMDFVRIDKEAFLSCPDDSIDYAVMEKTSDAVVFPLDAGWSDVGSWSSLWEISDKDENGNFSVGDVLNVNSTNCYTYAESSLVCTLGLEDLIVVQTKDAVLVSHRDHVQDVKKIVELIKTAGRQEHSIHREVFRPWGQYDSIDKGDRYQVKRIKVKPGEGLSLQMHHHRAEHWVVVTGTARVTINDSVSLLTENESVFIPLGAKHTLENPGKIPLELIEIRSGIYLEEDDVIRFADRYGRI